MECDKCTDEIQGNDVYEFKGKNLCDDCYMELLSPPKACDPWVVHSAKTFLGDRITAFR